MTAPGVDIDFTGLGLSKEAKLAVLEALERVRLRSLLEGRDLASAAARAAAFRECLEQSTALLDALYTEPGFKDKSLVDQSYIAHERLRKWLEAQAEGG